MQNKNNEYHFVSHWRVKASPEEVYKILDDAKRLTEWWPAVYLDVKVRKQGDENGVGKIVELYTKGWLPYTLRWKFRATKRKFPQTLALEALGDFKGRGEWTIKADGDFCQLIYDWRIIAEKPILRYLSFFLKPLFSANHHWAMQKGEESLRLELQRRNAKTAEEKAAVPPPPQPTFPHNLTNNKIL